MILHTIIPIKNLNDAKKRLSTLLNEEKRKQLSIYMILDVFKSVSITSEIEEVIVVSPDLEVLNYAKTFGFKTILEKAQVGVNKAVKTAISFCLENEATSTLILPADIPLIQSIDIKKIIEATNNTQSVIITPSKRMDGTNALLLSPPDVIQTSYDNSSYKVHKQNALNKKIPFIEIKLDSIMLDLDIPKDIEEFMTIISNTNTYRFLSKEIIKNS